jgi:hypothetical protein
VLAVTDAKLGDAPAAEVFAVSAPKTDRLGDVLPVVPLFGFFLVDHPTLVERRRRRAGPKVLGVRGNQRLEKALEDASLRVAVDHVKGPELIQRRVHSRP